MSQDHNNPREHFERRDERPSGRSGSSSNYSPDKKKTNYTPYIIAGVIIIAALAVLIFV